MKPTEDHPNGRKVLTTEQFLSGLGHCRDIPRYGVSTLGAGEMVPRIQRRSGGITEKDTRQHRPTTHETIEATDMSGTPRILTEPCKDHGYRGNGQEYAKVHRPAGNRNKVLLHRWVFQQEHGYLPPVVMHACDNRRCIEPTHLEAGDWDKNNKDRAAKGRSAANVHARRRLTESDVTEIRARFAVRANPDPVNGVVALARELGVDETAIYQIAYRRTYRDVA